LEYDSLWEKESEREMVEEIVKIGEKEEWNNETH
jgi:hypothetical protein